MKATPSAHEFAIAESQIVKILPNGITFLWGSPLTKSLDVITRFRGTQRNGITTACSGGGNAGHTISVTFIDTPRK